jgi:hypothetical protein
MIERNAKRDINRYASCLKFIYFSVKMSLKKILNFVSAPKNRKIKIVAKMIEMIMDFTFFARLFFSKEMLSKSGNDLSYISLILSDSAK